MSPLNNLPGPALSLGSVRASYGRPGPDPHRPGPHRPGVVAGPGGTPAGSRGAASPAAPVRRRGRGAKRCPDSRRDLARRLSRRRPRAGAHPAPACKTNANESTGTGTRTRTGPVMRTTTNPRSGARPRLRAGADPAGETRPQGGSGAGEDPGPACVIPCPLNEITGPGPARAGAGLRNASSARRNPPRLAPCEPSATESACARFSPSRLAQCDLR